MIKIEEGTTTEHAIKIVSNKLLETKIRRKYLDFVLKKYNKYAKDKVDNNIKNNKCLPVILNNITNFYKAVDNYVLYMVFLSFGKSGIKTKYIDKDGKECEGYLKLDKAFYVKIDRDLNMVMSDLDVLKRFIKKFDTDFNKKQYRL
mgnify:CR=1 FL=1